MDWMLTLGIALITGVVTLSAVALQNNAAARRTKTELQESAATEAARVVREDAATEASQTSADRAEATVLATQVVDAFFADINEVLAFREVDDDGFRTWFDQQWRAGKEVALRRVVGRVRDAGDRIALMDILDALAAQADFTRWNRTRTPRAFVESVLRLGLDIAMTIERGQAHDPELVARRSELGERLGHWEQYVAREEAREWEQQRREYRDEEAAHEAMIEAAQEAHEDEVRGMSEAAEWEADAARQEHEAAEADAAAEASHRGWDAEPEERDEPASR